MRWREGFEPTRMQRVALVSTVEDLRGLLVEVGDAGVVELDRPAEGDERASAGEAARLMRRVHPEGAQTARLSACSPDLPALVEAGRTDLVAGEAELEGHAAGAVVRDQVAGLVGWVPTAELQPLADRVSPLGGGVVPLSSPRGLDPPTLLRAGGGLRESFGTLVRTYATVPYADVDPTLLAGLAYVLMFGVMFGDAGHGALLVLCGVLLRLGRPKRLARFGRLWLFVVGAGVAATLAGLLYGEFFGPTGVVPVLWIAPLEDPLTLLAAALGMGAVLLGGAYVVGTVNRWREGRWPLALLAPSGIAGSALFLGLGLVVLGLGGSWSWLVTAGSVVFAAGLTLAFVGFLAGAGGGAAGATQATVQLFDSVMQLGTNLVSFTRLAAFGLTHAALGKVVWDGTTSLVERGGLLVLAGVLVFVVGNTVAFALEALVAGVQALRLEYYELFSRVFVAEGRPFTPWHVEVDRAFTPALVPPPVTRSETGP
jgi:V/A-type H+/Na+-transporting ATPase subunit I